MRRLGSQQHPFVNILSFSFSFVFCCFVAIVSFRLPAVEGKCVNLNDVNSTNICATLLPYQFAYIDDNVCPTLVNPLISTVLSPSLWATISPPSCQKLVATLMCAQTYPPCSLGRVLPCSDMCTPLLTACGSSYPLLQQTFGFNCSTVSSSTSTPSPSISPTTGSSNTNTCNQFNLTSSPTPVAQCVNYNDPLVGGKFCASVFNAGYQVFVPWTSSIASMEKSLYSIDFVFRIMPHACAMQLATFLCELTLPSCNTSSNSWHLPLPSPPLPSPPCQSECFALQNECVVGFAELTASADANTQALAMALQPPLGCNATGHYAWSESPTMCGANATLDFPPQTKLYAALPGGQSISVTCNSRQTVPISRMTLDSVHCQAPLIDSTNFDTNVLQGSCAMPCPSLELTSEEWFATDSITTVLSTLSTVVTGFLVVTWCIFPSKRQQHYNLFLFISIFALHFIGWVSLLATNGRLSLVACRSNTQNCAWGDAAGNCALCSVQAFVSVYGMLSLTGWWTVIAMELTSKIFFSHWLVGKYDERFQRFLLGFGIVFPLCFGLPPLILGKYTANPPLQFCFINDEDLKNACFWIPLLTCGALVTAMMISVIIKIFRSSHSLPMHRKQPRWWTRLVRPFLFIFIFYYFVVLYLFLDYYNKAKTTEFSNSTANYVLCLLVTPTANCGAAPADRPSVYVNYFSTATTTSLGCLVFCVFGMTRENWHLWKGLCTRGSLDGSGGTNTGKSDNSRSGEHGTGGAHGGTQRSSGITTSSSNRDRDRDRDGTTTTTKSTPIQQHTRRTIVDKGRASTGFGGARSNTSMNTTSCSNMSAANIELVEREVVIAGTMSSGGASPAGVGAGSRLAQRQRTSSIPSPALVQLNLHSTSSFTPTPMLRTLLSSSKMMGGGGERGSSSSSATVAATHATTTAAAPSSTSSSASSSCASAIGSAATASGAGANAVVEDEAGDVVGGSAVSNAVRSSATPSANIVDTSTTTMTTTAAATNHPVHHHPNVVVMTTMRRSMRNTSTSRTAAGSADASAAAAVGNGTGATTPTSASTSTTPTITTARGSMMIGDVTATTGLLTHMDATEIISPYGASSSSASSSSSSSSSSSAILSPFSPISPSAPSSTLPVTRHLV